MKNVEMSLVDKHFLVLRIDLQKEFGLSRSGRTVIIGSTGGSVPLPYLDIGDVAINCTCYKERSHTDNILYGDEDAASGRDSGREYWTD